MLLQENRDNSFVGVVAYAEMLQNHALVLKPRCGGLKCSPFFEMLTILKVDPHKRLLVPASALLTEYSMSVVRAPALLGTFVP